MQQSIRRVDPISVMKVFAVLYAALGLLVGVIFSLISFAGFFAMFSQDSPGFGRFLLGTSAMIIAPLFYGALGGIIGLIMSVIYNAIAQFTGGIQIELESPGGSLPEPRWR